MLFRAVAFARLYDWGVAALDVRVAPKKTPVKQIHESWASVSGFEKKSKRDRLLGILFLVFCVAKFAGVGNNLCSYWPTRSSKPRTM